MSNKSAIVMGYLKQKSANQDENLILKKYGYGSKNTRGERLIRFACENKLAILNTFKKKKNSKRSPPLQKLWINARGMNARTSMNESYKEQSLTMSEEQVKKSEMGQH